MEERERYSLGKGKIICIGDSITGWNNIGTPDKWPVDTYTRFLQEYSGREVINLGVAGAESDICEDRVRYAKGNHPEVSDYVIGFGTNDIGRNPDIADATKNLITNLGNGVSHLREKDVYILGIPDVNYIKFFSRAEELRNKRKHVNQELYDFCVREGLVFVDLANHLDKEHFMDAIHPNEKGASRIAIRVYQALNPETILK